MKNLFSVVILFVVLLFGVYVHAENNPLLSVFENLKAGMDVKNAQEAIEAYGDRISGGVYFMQPGTKLSVARTTVSWVWVDPDYRCNGCFAPTAHLEILYVGFSDNKASDPAGKILKITYRYAFLELEKTLVK